MSDSKSRRRFLKNSAAIGGLTAIAGCGGNSGQTGSNENGNGNQSTPTPVPFPATTGVTVTPVDNVLQVVIWFTDPVNAALDDRNMSAADLVTFTPAASNKTAVHVDSQSQDGYLTRIHAEGVVTTTTKNGVDIASSRELKLHSGIPLADSTTGNSEVDSFKQLFTFSVETITKANGGVHFPESKSDMYLFPFRQTYTELANAPSVSARPNVSSYKDIWASKYNSTEFPTHTIEGSLDGKQRTVPAIDYYNNRPFLSLLKLSEGKRELYSHLVNLIDKHDELNAQAWRATRDLVGEAMYAAAGMKPEDAAKKTGMELFEAVALGFYQGAGLMLNGVGTVTSLITAYDNITEAGEHYTDALMKSFNSTSLKVITSNIKPAYKSTKKYQEIEEQYILPALTLSAPKATSRRAAHRFYDKHLDTERAALYSLFTKTRNEAANVGWQLNHFNRALLYETDTLKPHFVDITKDQRKLKGTVATEVSVAALSSTKAAAGDPISGVESVEPRYYGYNDRILMDQDGGTIENNVALEQPVGRIYKDLKVRPSASHFTSDDSQNKSYESDVLESAKYFVHLAEIIDMLLHLTRIQQTILQAHANMYRTETSERSIETPSEETPRSQKFVEIPASKDNWTVAAGQWDFSGGYIHQNSRDINKVIFANDVSLDAGELTADITSIDGKYGQHIVWRSDGEHRSNYYFFGVILNRQNNLTNFVKWGYFENGNPVSVERVPFSNTSISVSKGETHTFRVRFVGDVHEMWIDDQLLFSVTNQTHETGTVGFHCGGKTRFSNIRYRQL